MKKTIRSLASHTAAAVVSASVTAYFVYNFQKKQQLDNNLYQYHDENDKEGQVINKQWQQITELNSSKGKLVDQPIMPFSPKIPIHIMKPNENLEIAFDARTRNPLYVLERLVVQDTNVDNAKKQKRAGMRFYENKRLPEHFRSRNHYYHHSGYDRGHIAAAANFNYDEKSMRDTFSLCNISPQHSDLNRGVWASLENFARQIARDEERASKDNRKRVTYVCSGPLWLPTSATDINSNNDVIKRKYLFSYEAIGVPPSLVSVPSHFFKIIVVNDESIPGKTNIAKVAAFVVPNVKKEKRSIIPTLVRFKDLESVTGMHFFANACTNYDNAEVCWKDKIDFITQDIIKRLNKSNTIFTLEDKHMLPELTVDETTFFEDEKKKRCRNFQHDVEHLCSKERCNRILTCK